MRIPVVKCLGVSAMIVLLFVFGAASTQGVSYLVGLGYSAVNATLITVLAGFGVLWVLTGVLQRVLFL